MAARRNDLEALLGLWRGDRDADGYERSAGYADWRLALEICRALNERFLSCESLLKQLHPGVDLDAIPPLSRVEASRGYHRWKRETKKGSK